MIFNDEFLFIHVPKTAGMAVGTSLCRSLKGDVYYAAGPGPHQSRYKEIVIEGDRHQTLNGADQFFEEAGLPHRLAGFRKIMVMMRNPYEIEVSRFHYLRLGYEWDRGIAQSRAMEGNFAEFVGDSKWWFDYADYYTVDGEIPKNLHIVRYEDFADTIGTDFATFFQIPFVVEQDNVSHRSRYQDYYDEELEHLVYKKYQWLFDRGYYPREQFGEKARLSVFSADDDWVRLYDSKKAAYTQYWIDRIYRLVPLPASGKRAVSGWLYARFGSFFRGTHGYSQWLSRQSEEMKN